MDASTQHSPSSSYTEELKSEPNYPKETGSGPPSGAIPNMKSMGDGRQVVRSTSWKVEGILAILNSSEEALKLQDLHYIGVLTTHRTNTRRLMYRRALALGLTLTISIPMVSTGTIRFFIPTSTTIQTEPCLWITLIKAIGRDQV